MMAKVRNNANNLLRACCNTADSNRQAHRCASISPQDTSFLPFPFSKFRHCYLSLQSPVSSFPHGTCLLLVSNICSALDEVYHQLHAPIPRNMTLRRHTVHWELQVTHRTITLTNAFFQRLIAAPQLVAYLNPTTQDIVSCFQTERFLMHSPLLKESLWVSHPPPTYMLKFSGLAGLDSCFSWNCEKETMSLSTTTCNEIFWGCSTTGIGTINELHVSEANKQWHIKACSNHHMWLSNDASLIS